MLRSIRLGCALLCSSLKPRAPLPPACLLCALLLKQAPCLASPCLPARRSASHTCPVLRFTLPRCATLTVLHSPWASFHSISLPVLCCASHTCVMPCFTLLRCASHTCTTPRFTLLPCARPASHTCTTPRFTLLPCARSASHTHSMPRFTLLRSARSASHACPVPRFTLLRCCALHLTLPSASLHPGPLCSALLLTHAPCLTSPLTCASHPCPLPHFTPVACSALCFSHMRHAPPHYASLCSAVHLTHAPCLASPRSSALFRFASHTHSMPCFTLLRSARSASHTCPVPRLNLLGSYPLCSSHNHTPCLASHCPAMPALPLTLPPCLAFPLSAALFRSA